MATILETHDVHVSFGGVKALVGVNVNLKEEEILTVIGPNWCRQNNTHQLRNKVRQKPQVIEAYLGTEAKEQLRQR